MRGKCGCGVKKTPVFLLCFTCLAIASRSGFAKFRLAKFRGIRKENFVLHLKETGFKYNTKNLGQNLYQNLLKLIRENLIKF